MVVGGGNEKSPVSQKEPSQWSRVPSGSQGGRNCYASNRMLMAQALKMLRLQAKGPSDSQPQPRPPPPRHPTSPHKLLPSAG